MKVSYKGAAIPPPPPAIPSPDNDAVKIAAADAKSRAVRRTAKGTYNSTLASGPEGILGAAPISKPELKNNLGA